MNAWNTPLIGSPNLPIAISEDETARLDLDLQMNLCPHYGQNLSGPTLEPSFSIYFLYAPVCTTLCPSLLLYSELYAPIIRSLSLSSARTPAFLSPGDLSLYQPLSFSIVDAIYFPSSNRHRAPLGLIGGELDGQSFCLML